jgi:polysaccharide export outer membrane protein
MRAANRILVRVLLLSGALFLMACSTAWLEQRPKVVGAKIAAIPHGAAAAISAAPAPAPITALRRYRVVEGDDLEVTLAGTQTVLGVATVSPSGMAVLPRKGETHVAGLTLGEIEQVIEKDHGGVKVRLRSPAEVYVVGAVERPGGVAFEEGLTLVALLEHASGATYRADLRTVFVKPRGEPEQAVDFDPALPILPGDVVRLKERYF